MATGAAPALEQKPETKIEGQEPSEKKAISLKEKIIRKLSEIFEHNERLGVTRP
jgi:hypothetical protein